MLAGWWPSPDCNFERAHAAGSSQGGAYSATGISGSDTMTAEGASEGPKNVLGGPLQACCTEPGKVCAQIGVKPLRLPRTAAADGNP